MNSFDEYYDLPVVKIKVKGPNNVSFRNNLLLFINKRYKYINLEIYQNLNINLFR